MRDRQIIGSGSGPSENAPVCAPLCWPRWSAARRAIYGTSRAAEISRRILTWALAKALDVEIDAFTELNEPVPDVESRRRNRGSTDP